MIKLEFIHGVNTSEGDVRQNVEWALAHVQPNTKDFWDRPAVILGGGPSVDKYQNELKQLAGSGAVVFALNNAFRWGRRMGVHADYVVMMDARPENAEFTKDLDLAFMNFGKEPTWLIASQCHKDVFESLFRQDQTVQMWHSAGSEAAKDLHLKGIVGGGTVLSRAINIAYDMGFRKLHLFGCDSSFEADHHAYEQPLNDEQAVIEAFTPNKGGPFKTSGPLAAQAEFVFKQMSAMKRYNVAFEVHADGLLPAMWQEYQEARDNPDVWEPHKYKTMWQVDAYRKSSPAAMKGNIILRNIGKPPGKVVDFGIGTGKMAKVLKGQGWDVLGIDIAPNCLDEDVDVPLCIAKLWELPDEVQGDIGLCFDVMEHIPTEKVGDVLQNIKKSVPRCLFNISYRHDTMGALIGERLHLTVKPPEWWMDTLQGVFPNVTYQPDADIYICEG